MSEERNINPDEVLARLLDKQVRVQNYTIRAYGDEERPNTELADEFIDVEWNGGARSLTTDPMLFTGSLAVTIWCKAQADGRAKKQRVQKIIAQIAPLVHRRVAGGFVFTFNPANVIMPTTTNLSTGYSTTTIGVEWRVSR